MPRIGATSDTLPVPSTREVNTGTGLTGGGTLLENRLIEAVYGTGADTVARGSDTRFGKWDLFTGTATTNGQTPVYSTADGLFHPGTPPATMDAEQVRDIMGVALVAGANVTITVNDAGDTITIASSGGGTLADATSSAKGVVQLAGDLGGTAAVPLVPNKANTSLVLTAGTGLTGGGNLTANRTFTVAYGTTAGTALEGVTKGANNGIAPLDGTARVPQANLPIALRPVVAQTGATGTVTLDAALGSNRAITITGNITIAPPSNPADGQRLVVEVVNGTAVTYTVAFDAAITNLSGATIPVSLVGNATTTAIFGMYYSTRKTRWYLLGANWET